MYAKHTFFNLPSGSSVLSSFGVTDIVITGKHIFVCGSDGSVKYIRKKLNTFAPISYNIFHQPQHPASNVQPLAVANSSASSLASPTNSSKALQSTISLSSSIAM